ncbi:MAG: SGNH/GDSL hydrolase family protein [Bacteroidota bacterium]
MKRSFLFIELALLCSLVTLFSCHSTPPRQPDTPPGALYTDSLVWKQHLSEKQFQEAAFDYVERDSNLPDVLIMGNSISIGYTPYVREALTKEANVYRIFENSRDLKKARNQLDKWLAGDGWEVIHFNWGLHDLKYLKDGKLDSEGEQNISPEEYRELLTDLVQRLTATKANLIWATTSYIPEGALGRVRGEEEVYNQIAAEVMAQYPDILIDDQFALTAAHLGEQRERNVHFLPEGMKRQGDQVADHIRQALKQ